MAPISTIDGSNVVVHLTKPALAVVFDEATTRASLRAPVKPRDPMTLDIDETAAVEKEAEEALIATHVSWQLGTRSIDFASGTSDASPALATKTSYVRRRLEQTFVNVAEFWLRRDEFL